VRVTSQLAPTVAQAKQQQDTQALLQRRVCYVHLSIDTCYTVMHRHAPLAAVPYDLSPLNTKGVLVCAPALKYSRTAIAANRCIHTSLALAHTAAKPNFRAKKPKTVRRAPAPCAPRCTVQYVSVCIQYSGSSM
jgi:hypothetical protein